jgi:two-component system, NarL family, sensor histidine kinase DesK
MAMFRVETSPATTASGRARRWRLFAGVWLLLLIEPLREVLDQPTLVERIAGIALIVLFCFIYIFLLPQARERNAHRSALPLALGLITAALAAMIGPAALSTLPFILVTIAVLRTTALALAVTAWVTAFIVIVPQFIPAWDVTGWQWARGASVGFAGLAAVGFTRLIKSNLELHEAREQVARLATESERLRIARDLHDLLGHSLTTIAVKAELAQRMVHRDPARAADEMSEVAGLARQGLADVRAAVTGYREVSLATELANAREVLTAAGISAEIPHAVDAVPGELRELFGWVVREGVTNVVRHSRAQRVRINLEPRAIEIVNDGVAAEMPANWRAGQNGERQAGSGHGLTGLAERAAVLGARVEADSDPDQASSFRLRVEAPAT